MAGEILRTYSFPAAGPRNTEKTLRALIERALQHLIMKKSPLTGTPLLQQITLRDKGIPQRIRGRQEPVC